MMMFAGVNLPASRLFLPHFNKGENEFNKGEKYLPFSIAIAF